MQSRDLGVPGIQPLPEFVVFRHTFEGILVWHSMELVNYVQVSQNVQWKVASLKHSPMLLHSLQIHAVDKVLGTLEVSGNVAEGPAVPSSSTAVSPSGAASSSGASSGVAGDLPLDNLPDLSYTAVTEFTEQSNDQRTLK